jgi:hypothetical protein
MDESFSAVCAGPGEWTLTSYSSADCSGSPSGTSDHAVDSCVVIEDTFGVSAVVSGC